MGILNGSKALFSLNGLSLNHVTEIAKKMAEVNGRAGGHPRICIDASWLERKARNRCAEIIGILKEDGFAITVVFDPPSRHHSKVVSIARCGKRENARLDYYAARFQAKLVSEELSKGSISNDERAELEKELDQPQNATEDTMGDSINNRKEPPTDDSSTKEEPDYCAVDTLCRAICCELNKPYSHLESECVGYNIIHLRSNKVGMSKTLRDSVLSDFRNKVCRGNMQRPNYRDDEERKLLVMV